MVEGGWHLTSWGSSADLVTKLTSWGHADMFENTRKHPGLLDPTRLSRCMANCLSPLGYLEPPFALPPKQRHHWTLAQVGCSGGLQLVAVHTCPAASCPLAHSPTHLPTH